MPRGIRAGWNAARATSLRPSVRSVPTTPNLPSSNFTSASAHSSRCAAIFLLLASTLSAAVHSAVPPMTVEREPIVPMPQATRSVSPSMYRTSRGSRPRRSWRICLNVVSWPWPWFLLPIRTVAPPLGSKRISAYSGCGPAAFSIALAMPIPRSRPRFFDSPRREPLVVGERERLLHALRKIAAVVGQPERVLVRHRLGRDHVSVTQLDRIAPQLAGGVLDQPLDHVRRLRKPGPAI